LLQIVSLLTALAILGKLISLGYGDKIVDATMMTVILLWGLFFPYFCRMGLERYRRTHGRAEVRASVALRSVGGTVLGALVLIAAYGIGNAGSTVGLVFALQTSSSVFLGFMAPFTIGLAAGYLLDRHGKSPTDQGAFLLSGPTVILSAELRGSADFMRWVYLTFWSLLVLTGLSPLVDNWTNMGSSGVAAGLMVAAVALPFVVALTLKLRARPGLYGIGVRIPDGARVELVRLDPGAKRSEQLAPSLSLVAGKDYPNAHLTAVVNIARRQDRDWAVGHLALKGDDDQAIIVLDFLSGDRAESQLYVAGNGQVFFLGDEDVLRQLRSISSLLKPLHPRFQLTFTESVDVIASTAQLGGTGLGLAGVVAGAAGAAIDAAYLQSLANERLAKGEVPVDSTLKADLVAIVEEFGFELVPNDRVVNLRQTSPDEIKAILL
jgi:hypothetical protein